MMQNEPGEEIQSRKATFGSRIRELRNKKGISQTELSRRIPMLSNPFLNQLENGKARELRRLDSNIIFGLARELGVRPDELYDLWKSESREDLYEKAVDNPELPSGLREFKKIMERNGNALSGETLSSLMRTNARLPRELKGKPKAEWTAGEWDDLFRVLQVHNK